MKIILGNKNEKLNEKQTIVGLGNFDGIHIGHATIINTIINYSKITGLKSLVYTFERHPESVIRRGIMKPIITTNKQKIEILAKTELDILYLDDFTDEFSTMDAATFVKKVVVDKLRAKHVVVGYNYRFGYKGKGTVDELRSLGEEYGFGITIIPPIKSGRMVVSSSLIRQKIAEGDIDSAYNLLGRHFSITGFVQPGKRIGHQLGVPTANIHPKPYLILPPNGVYYTKTLLHDKLYSSITNMGVNPTVNYKNPDPTERIMETHILNFDQNIYNEYIEVFFIKKIRDEKKFANTDELAVQLAMDIEQVEKYSNFGYNT